MIQGSQVEDFWLEIQYALSQVQGDHNFVCD